MKRTILILCIVAGCNSALLATSVRVGKGTAIPTIAEGISKVNAGDTVWVEQGTYHEHNLVIEKPVVLKGINYPVIDGEHKYENISIKADNVVVDGFKICNSAISSLVDYAGVKIYNRQHVTVINNILEDCFFGIYSQHCMNCIIKGNRLTAHQVQEQESGNGIHCWKCDSMQITANTISGHRDGIYFEFVSHSIIWRNISRRNLRYGLHFMFSNDDTYAVNIFENNSAGVSVMFSKGVKMYHNCFTENWGDGSYGILLKEISDGQIEGNTFLKNTSGIYMEGASRIIMSRNSFNGNGWALKIQASCMDITVQYNNFCGNTFDVGTNGTLVLNTFDHNYWDKYEGYDINRNGIGDVSYRPVSLYSMIVERNPPAMALFHSLMTTLLDKSERVIPSLTPEQLKDEYPLMKPLKL